MPVPVADSFIADEYAAETMRRRGFKMEKLRLVRNYFEPRDKDLEKIADAIGKHSCGSVLDVGCGTGDLLNKLATTCYHKVGFGLDSIPSFLGIDTKFWDAPLPKAYLPTVKFEYNGIESMANLTGKGNENRRFDCVICSWMPQWSDWRGMMCKISNKLVVLVLSDYFNTATPLAYMGCEQWGFKQERKVWHSGDSIIQIHEKAKK